MSKKTHEHTHHRASQEGFISNRLARPMNKNEKIIMGILIAGIVVFLALSIIVLFGKNGGQLTNLNQSSNISPTKNPNATPYPTIPEVVNATVQLNSREFIPRSVEIKAGGFVSFFNSDLEPFTLEGAEANSSMLNIGPIEINDFKEVTFQKSGTYIYRNKNKPSETGVIIVR